MATPVGIQTTENWNLRSSERPIEARLDIGDVLLTASIAEVLGQIIVPVMAGNPALAQKFGEGKA